MRCVLGATGAVCSRSALASGALGMTVFSAVEVFGARAFNCLGKYLLYIGNITNGNLTNTTQVAELLS